MPYWQEIKEIEKNFVIGNKSLNGYEHNVLFRNDGDSFAEVGHVTGADSVYDSRGVSVLDYDEDGDPDLVVTALRRPLVLYENLRGNENNFLQLKLTGASTMNRQAIGARIRILSGGRIFVQELAAGSSFLSQQSLLPIFGLGKIEKIDHLEIRWPATMEKPGMRETSTYENVPINGMVSITQGNPAIEFRPMKKSPAKGPEAPRENNALLSMAGKASNLQAFRGKVVVANLWATWCTPCRKEIPEMRALYETWKSRGVEVLGITFENEAKDRVSQAMWEQNINYPVFLADPAKFKDFGNVTSIPTTVVLDREGKERFRQQGLVRSEDLHNLLAKLAAEKTAQ